MDLKRGLGIPLSCRLIQRPELALLEAELRLFYIEKALTKEQIEIGNNLLKEKRKGNS